MDDMGTFLTDVVIESPASPGTTRSLPGVLALIHVAGPAPTAAVVRAA